MAWWWWLVSLWLSVVWLPGLASSVSLLVSPSVFALLSRENVAGYEGDLQYKPHDYQIDWFVEL